MMRPDRAHGTNIPLDDEGKNEDEVDDPGEGAADTSCVLAQLLSRTDSGEVR